MINELYTILNNSLPVADTIGEDFIDPEFRPRNLDGMTQDALNKLLGNSQQAKQYWLTLIRHVYRDEHFWGEPMGYFDPRGGYDIGDLWQQLNDVKRIPYSSTLQVRGSRDYWYRPEYAVARWQLSVSNNQATLSPIRDGRPGNSMMIEFTNNAGAIFPIDTGLNLVVGVRSKSGRILWATSPTTTLEDRVRTIQLHYKPWLTGLAASTASRFPAALRDALLDLSLCHLDATRAAGAILLLVGGNIGFFNEKN